MLVSCVAAAAEDGERLRVDVKQTYGSGVVTYQIDRNTQLTGWRMSDRWFFGRVRSDDTDFGFVWQGKANQFVIDKEGLRWSRRL